MRKFQAILLASAGVVALASGASAAVTQWSDGASSWFTAANWNGGAVPGAGDVVTVFNGGTARIDGARATAALSSLTISGGSTVDLQTGGTLSATTINIGTGTPATLLISGTGNVNGAIAMNSGIISNQVIGATLSNAITLTGASNTLSSSTVSLFSSGVISGTGALTIAGVGQVVLTANETYSGGTTVNPGATLSLGQGTAAGSVTGNITDNGTLSLNHNAAFIVNNTITGAGGLNSVGSNTLTANDTYSGTTVIQTGTLFLSGAGSISNSSAILFSGAHNASLDISGSGGAISVHAIQTCNGCTTTDTGQIAGGSINLGANTLIVTVASGSYLGAITGTGGLNVTSGSQTLAGANT